MDQCERFFYVLDTYSSAKYVVGIPVLLILSKLIGLVPVYCAVLVGIAWMILESQDIARARFHTQWRERRTTFAPPNDATGPSASSSRSSTPSPSSCSTPGSASSRWLNAMLSTWWQSPQCRSLIKQRLEHLKQQLELSAKNSPLVDRIDIDIHSFSLGRSAPQFTSVDEMSGHTRMEPFVWCDRCQRYSTSCLDDCRGAVGGAYHRADACGRPGEGVGGGDADRDDNSLFDASHEPPAHLTTPPAPTIITCDREGSIRLASLEMTLDFESDSSFPLNAVIAGITVPLVIREIRVAGRMRIDIWQQAPPHGGTTFFMSFLRAPLLDFAVTLRRTARKRSMLIGGLDLAGVPGVSDWLHNLVAKKIDQFTLWPQRISFTLGGHGHNPGADSHILRVPVATTLQQNPIFLGAPQAPPAVVNRANATEQVSREFVFMRSEERRVGKECRSRWSPYH
eukprot:TRINITY_DN2185_c0_g1_i2.p1 TRINITY_DN2185_c0_g1~~TRINITY_DN2185_c0_g1_i2.p1  ORF type:complete len:453 (-),score=66.72 TRINITY_DN2185_c0_g1_i2:60-1418(-)